jgi:hypothetical protein
MTGLQTPILDLFGKGLGNAATTLPTNYTNIAEQGLLQKLFTGKDGLFTLDNVLKPVGMAGGLWSAYNQQRMADKQFKLQKNAYEYNKALSEEERKRRLEMDKSFNFGYGN